MRKELSDSKSSGFASSNVSFFHFFKQKKKKKSFPVRQARVMWNMQFCLGRCVIYLLRVRYALHVALLFSCECFCMCNLLIGHCNWKLALYGGITSLYYKLKATFRSVKLVKEGCCWMASQVINLSRIFSASNFEPPRRKEDTVIWGGDFASKAQKVLERLKLMVRLALSYNNPS